MVILILVAYGVGGFFSGIIRRLVGFVALYAGLFAATNMGLQAGGILVQSSNFDTPEARVYGFFGILFGVLLIVEVGTQIAHNQIQIPALALNRTFGVTVGLITGLVLSVVFVYELGAAANPFGGPQLDPKQIQIREAYNGSHVMVPLMKAIQKPFITLLQPALPADPQIYFGPGPVFQ